MRATEFIAAMQKGQVGPAYFLRGPDRFLQEECRKAVVNSIPPDSRQWCLTELEFAAGELAHALEGAEQMPMLGGHNFLLISDPEDFKCAGDEDVEASPRLPGTPLPLLHRRLSSHRARPAPAIHHPLGKESPRPWNCARPTAARQQIGWKII